MRRRVSLWLLLIVMALNAEAKDVVVFVPGLYGSALKSASDGDAKWFSLAELLWGEQSLAVCGSDQTTEQCDPLVSDGILQKVSIVPYLYEEDIYAEALKSLRLELGRAVEVKEFSYDWRLPIQSHAMALAHLVTVEQQKGNRVSLVAHSMGGLLVTYYLRYGAGIEPSDTGDWSGAKQIHRAVLAGVPFGGSVMAFIDLVEGRKVGFNSLLLSAAAYRTFRSTYELLPARTDWLRVDRARLPLTAGLLDTDDWRKHKWGGFGSTDSKEILLAEQALTGARQFKARIHRPFDCPQTTQVPILLIRGKGNDTLRSVVWLHNNQNESTFIHDQESWEAAYGGETPDIFGDGDAVVLFEDSALPESFSRCFSITQQTSSSVHRYLLSNPAASRVVAEFLLR